MPLQPWTIANFASISVSAQSSMLARHLANELTKMTEDPYPYQPNPPAPAVGPLAEIVAGLLHTSVLNGQVGREAATNLAAVNRVLIGYHESEVGRLNEMNEQLAALGGR